MHKCSKVIKKKQNLRSLPDREDIVEVHISKTRKNEKDNYLLDQCSSCSSVVKVNKRKIFIRNIPVKALEALGTVGLQTRL